MKNAGKFILPLVGLFLVGILSFFNPHSEHRAGVMSSGINVENYILSVGSPVHHDPCEPGTSITTPSSNNLSVSLVVKDFHKFITHFRGHKGKSGPSSQAYVVFAEGFASSLSLSLLHRLNI